MLRNIAVVLAVAIALLLGYAAMQPDRFRVARSIAIKAPPEAIFPLINDYRSWAAWSPWESKDPAMKKTYSGAATGLGAVYEWEGNGEVGSGRMEIVQSVPFSRIAVDLRFTRPFEAHNSTEFTLTGEGDSTTVTWTMYGPSPFIARVMGIFMNMDEMVGTDFESGLENLKRAAEHAA